jgi:hypothetical protein
MHFRLTARDNNGGVDEDDMTVSVDGGMGPFMVGDLGVGGGTLFSNDIQTIDWSVGNTEATCPWVEISLLALSTDGTRYCDDSDNADLFLGEFENLGTADVTLPDLNITRARFKVACANNIFFSLSANDFQVSGTVPISPNCKDTDLLNTDGTGDLVEACRIQIGAVSTTATRIDSGGGGGALILLPALLGLRWAGSRRRSTFQA